MHNVTTARQNLGLSQRELADKAGVSQTSINLLEHGYRATRPRILEAVAAALRVPAADLLNEESSP